MRVAWGAQAVADSINTGGNLRGSAFWYLQPGKIGDKNKLEVRTTLLLQLGCSWARSIQLAPTAMVPSTSTVMLMQCLMKVCAYMNETVVIS